MTGGVAEGIMKILTDDRRGMSLVVLLLLEVLSDDGIGMSLKLLPSPTPRTSIVASGYTHFVREILHRRHNSGSERPVLVQTKPQCRQKSHLESSGGWGLVTVATAVGCMLSAAVGPTRWILLRAGGPLTTRGAGFVIEKK